MWQQPTGLLHNAIVFGTGAEYNQKNLQPQTHITGFSSYFNNGDQPVVDRLRAGSTKKGMNWLAQFQQGLHDCKYTTGEAGGR